MPQELKPLMLFLNPPNMDGASPIFPGGQARIIAVPAITPMPFALRTSY